MPTPSQAIKWILVCASVGCAAIAIEQGIESRVVRLFDVPGATGIYPSRTAQGLVVYYRGLTDTQLDLYSPAGKKLSSTTVSNDFDLPLTWRSEYRQARDTGDENYKRAIAAFGRRWKPSRFDHSLVRNGDDTFLFAEIGQMRSVPRVPMISPVVAGAPEDFLVRVTGNPPKVEALAAVDRYIPEGMAEMPRDRTLALIGTNTLAGASDRGAANTLFVLEWGGIWEVKFAQR